jgi:hypothetical protein
MLGSLSRFGLVVVLGLAAGRPVMAQSGGNARRSATGEDQPVKLTGPAAKKADDLIRGYTARIEKEIEQDRKELERLRAELKELIDLRFEMATAIAEIRGELAAKGAYSTDAVFVGQVDTPDRKAAATKGQGQGIGVRRDLFYGLGSALPTEPTAEQREQLRRLAPRGDLKRLTEQLRAEVEAARTEVDQLVYKLLELRAGIPISYGAFSGMGLSVPWFGSIGSQTGMGMR